LGAWFRRSFTLLLRWVLLLTLLLLRDL